MGLGPEAWLAPELGDDVVRLEPLTASHVPALLTAASEDRSSYAYAFVPRTEAEMAAYVADALAARARQEAAPFAIRWRQCDRVVGSTRLANLEWWSWAPDARPLPGRPRRKDAGDPPDVAEIGWTWLAASAQRTAVNTACKALLLAHAFDRWGVERVYLKTDARNARSRAAIARLGARFEGILRGHLPAADAGARDTAMYGLRAADWPALRLSLVARGAVGAAAAPVPVVAGGAPGEGGGTRVGVDLVRVTHVAESLSVHGDAFARRLFTDAEIAYCAQHPATAPERYAARLAAKEAAFKILRIAERPDLRSIEVRRTEGGWCELHLHGAAREAAEAQGLTDLSLSFTHEGDHAIAFVLARSGR